MLFLSVEAGAPPWGGGGVDSMILICLFVFYFVFVLLVTVSSAVGHGHDNTPTPYFLQHFLKSKKKKLGSRSSSDTFCPPPSQANTLPPPLCGSMYHTCMEINSFIAEFHLIQSFIQCYLHYNLDQWWQEITQMKQQQNDSFYISKGSYLYHTSSWVMICGYITSIFC